MPPAWQRRDSEQQRFIDKFEHYLREEIESELVADDVGPGVVEVITDFGVFLLNTLRTSGVEDQLDETIFTERMLKEFLTRVEKFKRVDSERDVLILQMFMRLQNTIFSGVISEYEKERHKDPQQALHAPSYTAEVELEEEPE